MTRITQIGGRPVIDAKRPIYITVTPRDVRRAGTTQEADCCVMATACLRELHCIEVRVYLSRTYIRTNNSNWQRYWTSDQLRQRIIDMAAGIAFEPGELRLGVSPPSHKLGHRKRSGGTATVTGKKRKSYVLSHVRARASSE